MENECKNTNTYGHALSKGNKLRQTDHEEVEKTPPQGSSFSFWSLPAVLFLVEQLMILKAIFFFAKYLCSEVCLALEKSNPLDITQVFTCPLTQHGKQKPL